MASSLSQSERLIEVLVRSPHLFGPGVASVELLQTHISWVLLAGDFAWKIKKPVNFGFLDFSTRERRRRFCDEELRLNRRLAPDLYLDVVPITGSVDAPQFGGNGPEIEAAVRMKRFDQGRLLNRALADGRLTADDIDRLATEVAGFHEQIDRAAPDSHFGTPAAVLEPVEQNSRRLETPGTANDPDLVRTIKELHDWFRAEHAARTPDFVARKSAGLVRECHGDMHLGNMILNEDRSVTIFDGIEFNDSLRWIDVASEIAFLVMDLEDRGRPDFARRCLNGYLERTGDYEALRVLPYYMAYRATVRAKVASLRLEQPGLDAEEQARQRTEFAGYVNLAARCAKTTQPLLILTHGPSGSGKTTLTQPLVERLGAIRIRSDVERKRLFGLGPLDRSDSAPGSKLYSPEATQKTFARLRDIARDGLEAGRTMLVDATFLHRSQRDEFESLAKELGVPWVIVSFEAPDEVLRERVRARAAAGKDASEATLAVLEQQLRDRDPLDDEEMLHSIVIASTSNDAVERVVEEVVRRASQSAD